MTRNHPSTRYALAGGNVETVDLTMDDDVDMVPTSPNVPANHHPSTDQVARELEQIVIAEDDEAHAIPSTEDPADYTDDFSNDHYDSDDELRELTEDEWRDLARASTMPRACELVAVTTSLQIKITLGMCVELKGGDFLFIKSLGRNHAKGILLRRTRYANDMLPKKLNEVYAVLLTRAGAKDPAIDACQVVRSLDEIIAIRRVVFTNHVFPNIRYKDENTYHGNYDAVAESGLLVCRWKCIESYDEVRHKVVRQPILIHLKESECTSGKGMSPGILRQQWRGVHLGSVQAQGVNQPYSFGDLCSGAGGVVRGAEQSGLKVTFALDHWDPACRTLDANWPRVNVYEMDIFDFINTKWIRDVKVDILHISFPCQPHSMAHTVPGINDEANIATAYSVGEILKKCRPRVVTFEQTSGIINRGGYHYRALIHQLTACDYNVRAKIISCAAYGNAQARQRLIIIASCPGETLPPFPEETHGLQRGLKTPVTILDRLRMLSHHHIPHHMRVCRLKAGAPYDADQPLRHCITTDGGQGDLHPDGGRTFTLAELASLAGFPPTHRFVGNKTAIKKQIGNAVPACVAKALFDQIKRTMVQTDQAIAVAHASAIEID